MIEKSPEEVGKEKDEQEAVEISKDGSFKDGHEGGLEKEEDVEATTKEEKQQDQNVPKVHMPSVSPPHVDLANQQETMKIKYFFGNIVQNISP